jgi:hypothetical protein
MLYNTLYVCIDFMANDGQFPFVADTVQTIEFSIT